MDESSPRVVTSSQKGLFDRIFPHHHFKRPILPLFLFAFIALATGFSVLLAQKNQDIRNYAKESAPESSSTVNLILHLTKDPQTGEITVEEAVANNGFSPSHAQNALPKNLYTDNIELWSQNGLKSQISVKFQDFEFIDTQNEAKRNKFTKPELYVSFQVTTDDEVKIKDLKTQSIKTISSAKITQAISNKQNIPSYNVKHETNTNINPNSIAEGSTDGYLDLVFISDNYSSNEFGAFDNDVETYKNAIRTVVPFSEYINKIRIAKIYNTEQLCTQELTCNNPRIYAIASQVNHDVIIVAENMDNKGGKAVLGRAIVSRNTSPRVPGSTFIHEMGHAVAWLNDEYDYGEPASESEDYQNCDEVTSCGEWTGVPGTSCFLPCGYNNWYRPTKDICIMEGSWVTEYTHRINYDPVDEPAMRGSINAYSPIPIDSPMPGDSSWKWKSGWCVDRSATCINAGFQRPAFIYDYPNYCSDPNNPYNCSGYQYSGGGGNTPTPTPPGPTNPPNNGTLTVKVVQKGSGAKYPNKVTVREWYSSDCPNGCNSNCSNLVCKNGRNATYDPNGCGGSGCARWSNYTPNVGYYIGVCETCSDSGVINLPDNWEVTKFGCGNSNKLWTPGSRGATCTIEVENTESNRKIIQGYIFHDDETDKNAVKNSSTVEPPIAGASLTLYRVKPNGNSTLIETHNSNSKDKQNNFAFRISQNGNYRFDPPADISGYKLHQCSKVTKPKKIPTDNRYFYCTDDNGSLVLRQWTPNSKNPSKKIASGLIPFTGTTVNVDFPLENAQ